MGIVKKMLYTGGLTLTKRLDLLMNDKWLLGLEGFVATGSLMPAEIQMKPLLLYYVNSVW